MKTAIKLLLLLTGFTFFWISGSYCTCLAENHDETKINNKLDFGATIRFRYEYQKLFNGNELQFGYGHFWPDEFVKKQASNKQSNWIFLQWMYSFSHKLF